MVVYAGLYQPSLLVFSPMMTILLSVLQEVLIYGDLETVVEQELRLPLSSTVLYEHDLNEFAKANVSKR